MTIPATLAALAATFAFATHSPPVVAQPVYRCVTAAGTTFQDTACAARAHGERLELPAAPAAADPPPAVRELIDRYEARRSPAARAGGAGRASAARPIAEKPAYRCTDDFGATMFLNRPCPKPHASKGKRVPIVRQELVTQREACEGRHAALDPYERDKRGPPQCK